MYEQINHALVPLLLFFFPPFALSTAHLGRRFAMTTRFHDVPLLRRRAPRRLARARSTCKRRIGETYYSICSFTQIQPGAPVRKPA